MPVETGIYANYLRPPKSINEFAAEEQAFQSNAFKLNDQRQAQSDEAATREAYRSGGGDLTKTIGALQSAGAYKPAMAALEAQRKLLDTDSGIKLKDSQTGEHRAKTGQISMDVLQKQHREAQQELVTANTPEEARAILLNRFESGLLDRRLFENAINKIPHDQAQFNQGKEAIRAQLLGVKDAAPRPLPAINSGAQTQIPVQNPVDGSISMGATVNNTASPNTVLTQQGQDRRHATVSGNTRATIEAGIPITYYGTGMVPRGYQVPQPAVAPEQPQTQPQAQSVRESAPNEAAALARMRQIEALGQQGSVTSPSGQLDREFARLPQTANEPQRSLPPPILSPKARDAAAVAQLKPGGTAARPRELSAAGQKAVLDADSAVQSNMQALGYIKDALKINDSAMGFPGAAGVATAGSLLPGKVRPQAVDNTIELDNLTKSSVLPALKSTFGGNPTEGERKVLLDVAGSANKSPIIRKGIFERAEKAANERIAFNKKKAADLRAGTYFNSSSQQEAGQLAPGTVDSGYRFKGGDPADRNSWDKVSQ
jgi:hypothetical protein